MRSEWRAIARPIIAEVIARIGLEDEKKLRKELIKAYPFGQRANHPYKIWLDEIKVQAGKKKQEVNKNQLILF